VEASNLRPQQCECQKESRAQGATEEKRQDETPQNGTREQQNAQELHRPRLLQDETQTYDSKALSRWFASRPNARQEAREVAAALTIPTPAPEEQK